MQKNKNPKIIYQLTNEDAQNYAIEELGRKLDSKELKLVDEYMYEVGIPNWYDAIEAAVNYAVEVRKGTRKTFKETKFNI